ncbi:MAG: hypothetical protein WC483_06385 [Candidatus Paceibacterota bacterium]
MTTRYCSSLSSSLDRRVPSLKTSAATPRLASFVTGLVIQYGLSVSTRPLYIPFAVEATVSIPPSP